MCYNAPRCEGKQVRFLHEPVAVLCRSAYAGRCTLIPCRNGEDGHWKPFREGRVHRTESKYPSTKCTDPPTASACGKGETKPKNT